MSPGRCQWSLGSLLLLLGGNLSVLVKIHQDSINGTVGRSVLLPVSYRFDGAPCFPVPIFWTFSNSTDKLIACTVLNCSVGAGGAPSSCSANCFPHHMYRGRAELFPENGSLLLWDLQLNDSGVYRVTFKQPQQTWRISLTVHEQRFTPDHAGESNFMKQDYIHYCAIGICSSVSLLLLFLIFWYIRHRGAAQTKRRIIKQQQVSSVEESHMESTVMRDVTTIYDTIGGSFEQPQPRPPPEVVYTSITSPGPPRLDTGTYHFPV